MTHTNTHLMILYTPTVIINSQGLGIGEGPWGEILLEMKLAIFQPSSSFSSSPDAPWCEIRPTHASSKLVTTQFPSKKKEKWEKGFPVKSRNEPQNVV